MISFSLKEKDVGLCKEDAGKGPIDQYSSAVYSEIEDLFFCFPGGMAFSLILQSSLPQSPLKADFD